MPTISLNLKSSLYLQMTKMTMDGMRAEVRPEAEKRIRNHLLVEELGRAEGIMVEDSAVSAEIERVAAAQQDPAAAKREMSTNEMHDRIKRNLHEKALFDRLIALVTEGQEPVARTTAAAMPSITDRVQTGEDEKKETAAEETRPKLIIATH